MMVGNRFTPIWAQGIVWYQIFPERFWNGDPGNDPTLASLSGSWPHDNSPPWEVHPWTSDWYQLQPYEQENGRDIWHNIQRRRYGGDLQGILDRLDYLVDLGVQGLYLNPIFTSPSSHKYDGATYHHVDPHFGPDPEGDRQLIAAEMPHDPSTWSWTAATRLFLQLIIDGWRLDVAFCAHHAFWNARRRHVQNLFDSHDSNRLSSQIVNRDLHPYRDWENYHSVSKRSENPAFDTRKPQAAELAVQRQMVIFQMTYPGAPMIYYGDEAGMWGANDPCCRKPMLWPELDYEAEKALPDGSVRARPDQVLFDRALFAHYQKLIAIRRASPALQRGSYETVLTDDDRQLFGFVRRLNGESVWALFNAGEETEQIELQVEADGLHDLLTDDQIYATRNGGLSLTLPPLGACILRATG